MIERVIVIAIGLVAFGYTLAYAARLRQIGSLTTDQQAWAVFALGLIAAIVLLFRAARVGEVNEVSRL